MFAYQPQTSRAGQYLAEGIVARGQADAIRNERNFQNVMDGVGMVGDAAKAVAGFAMGGPAGAAMAAGGGGGGGGLLDTIVNAYAKKEQDKSDAKIYGSLMKVIAPAFGKDGNSILETFNSFENDAEKADFGRTVAGSLGVIGNMYAQTRSAGIRQNQQALTAAMPKVRNIANAQAQVAAGQGTFVGLPPGVNPDAIITE